MIEPTHPGLSVQRQCELLSLPRSSYYRPCSLLEESAENLQLMCLIDKEYLRTHFTARARCVTTCSARAMR